MNLVNQQHTKSIHRNTLHSYTLTTKQSEREIKETIPFTIATKRIKYLGINLPEETKDLYAENCKTLTKELRQHKQKQLISCSSTGRINIMKKTTFHKNSTDSMQSVSNYQWHFSQSQNKKLYNLDGNTKVPEQPKLLVKANLQKEKRSWRNQPS